MAGWDPFVRGPWPAGVRTLRLTDASRSGRVLLLELWYPASPRYFGLDVSPVTQDYFTVLPAAPASHQAAVRDADPAAGQFPLLAYSHTSLGHRREATFLCTHLASHGYIVAAPDHAGNTFVDLVARTRAGVDLTDAGRERLIARSIADRVPDLLAVTNALLNGFGAPVAEHVDPERLGVLGWSFGGWAALAAPEVDERLGAVVAMAPGGAANPLPGIIPATLSFTWRSPPPTLFLAAERDRFTLLSGIAELFERTPGRKWLFVLRHADHDHFGDDIAVELCPRAHAHLFTRTLALAHLDATLKTNAEAERFLADDPTAVLRARGVDAQ